MAERIWTAAEMESMTPDERAQVVVDGFRMSSDGLSPEFRARVAEKGKRIAVERGLLDPERA